MEATADICEVDPRTVQRLLERAGQRAENFHNLQMEKLAKPLEAVEMDELHGRASDDAVSSKARSDAKKNLLDRVAHWVASGFMRRWP